jgi:uncharacterized protein (DUF2267 family)
VEGNFAETLFKSCPIPAQAMAAATMTTTMMMGQRRRMWVEEAVDAAAELHTR